MSQEHGLPKGWCTAAIDHLHPPGRVCAYGVLQPGEDVERGTLLVRVCDVANGKIAVEKLKKIDPAISERYQRTILQGNEVLLTIVGTIGRSAVVPQSLKGANTARAVAVIPISESIDARYVELAFRNSQMRAQLAKAAHEVARKTLNLEDVRAARIPLAPINEQRRIVAKIEELFSDLDAGVAALERVRANLKRYRTAVLKAAVEGRLTAAWRATNPPKETGQELLERILNARRRKWDADQCAKFTAAGKEPPRSWRGKYDEPSPPPLADLPSIPATWTWTTLEAIGDVVGGITKDQKKAGLSGMRMLPYLRVANVQRGFLDLSEVKAISATEHDISDLRLEAGDVLFTEGGDRDKLGRGWVWSGELVECIHQNHVFRARLFSKQLQPRFVSHHGNTFGKEWFTKAGKQTTNLASINLGILRRFPVPLPPVEEQALIIAAIDEKLSQISAAEVAIDHGLARAARLRQSILKRAFEGKLVPQDAHDEPASVLLDRIKAARRQADQHPAAMAGRRRRSKQEAP